MAISHLLLSTWAQFLLSSCKTGYVFHTRSPFSGIEWKQTSSSLWGCSTLVCHLVDWHHVLLVKRTMGYPEAHFVLISSLSPSLCKYHTFNRFSFYVIIVICHCTSNLPLFSWKCGEVEAVTEASHHPATIEWRTRVPKNPARAKRLWALQNLPRVQVKLGPVMLKLGNIDSWGKTVMLRLTGYCVYRWTQTTRESLKL